MLASKANDAPVSSVSRSNSTGLIISVCLVAFFLATWLALKQIPRPDPFKPTTFREKMLSPYEKNAFRRLPLLSGGLKSVFIVPGSGHIWTVGYGGLIVVSQNRGISWERRSFPMKPPAMQSPKANKKTANLNHLWNIQQAHAASQPESKGNYLDLRQQAPIIPEPEQMPEKQKEAILQKDNVEPVPYLQSIFFVDETNGWIVGTGGTILSTVDGGENWNHQPSGTTSWLSSIHFVDREYGWAAGVTGTILSTQDGGLSWRHETSDTFNELRSIHFMDRERGWACGMLGMILLTVDGGLSWQNVTSGTGSMLNSIHFIDPELGWACGSDGTVLSSKDGGKSWIRHDLGMVPDLFSIHFVSREQGWAAGKEGTILSTVDGGKTWQSKTSGTGTSLESIYFSDSEHGWAAGPGIFLSTIDGGQSWHYELGAELSSIHFADREHGWISGAGGTILSTADGGLSWNPQSSGVDILLHSIYFIDREYGWACGEDGTILSTKNGGKNWSSQSSGVDVSLNSIYFLDREYGWAGGNWGMILSTKDGGRSWNRQVSGSTELISSIYFTDREHGWAPGDGTFILSTVDGGENWKQINTNIGTVGSLYFVDQEQGWAAGAEGTILSTENGGLSWNSQPSKTTDHLNFIHFIDRERGWVCGSKGTLLSTIDGGRNWNHQSTNLPISLTSIHFVDQESGWATGGGGTVLSTVDGGQTWNLPTYRRLPALWYYILCLALILASLFVVQRRGKPEPAGETVADLLASDRPLQAGDPDPLNLHRISSGLARFIANRNTDPPLTIAVTGEWGTGKSSLMNLLYHDLKKRRFQPVWFNAWHHQKGEQLLASLYANIREQAVPPLWHPSGLLFRLRLLFHRGRRNKLAFGALAFLLFAAYPFLESVILSLAGGMFALVKALIAKDMDSIRQLFSFTDLTVFIPDNWIGALLASPAVAGVWKAIRAFGLSPQNLLAFDSADSGKQRGLDPGARAHFAREFKDVASSLDLGAMVIFIDDLDRCSKENVVEILETINFLAVSGRCFIILGMARQWVETCVALQFKELAEETGNEKNNKDDGYAHRRRFAKQYLEKLINIEVPVPVPSPDTARALLSPQTADPTSRMEQMLTIIGKSVKKYGPLFCLAGLALLAWYLKDIFTVKTQPAKETPMEELFVLPASSQKGELVLQEGAIRIPLNDMAGQSGDIRSIEIVLKGQENALEKGIAIGTIGKDEQSAELVLRYKPQSVQKSTQPPPDGSDNSQPPVKDDNQTGEASFRPGAEDTSKIGNWLALLAGLGLGAIGLFFLVQRPQRFSSDSKNFHDALKIWHPWIMFVNRTPRTIKRFLNRLRYVAMRLRIEPEQFSLWERIKHWITGKPTEGIETFEGVPEPVLVALGAIYHVYPGWVKDDDTLQEIYSANIENLVNLLKSTFPETGTQAEAIHRTVKELSGAIEEYQNEFGRDIEPLIRHRDAFLAVMAETGM